MRASISAWYQPSAWSSTFSLARRAAVEPGGLLRVDQADAGQRRLVAQVPLDAADASGRGPRRRLSQRAVVERAGELGEPGPQAVGDPVGDPDADLRLALHRVLPAVRLLDAHAEDADDGLAAHRRRGTPCRSCRWPTGA